MLGLSVSVPIACWRKGHAREYLETEQLPPPATCYGFLLALVGEEDRERHVGARVTAGVVSRGEISVVLRTLWRVKNKREPPGTANNRRPDFQELVANSLLNVWVDSADEAQAHPTLEQRVAETLVHPERVDRFGGLSLGESTHLVDQVSMMRAEVDAADTFVVDPDGRVSLPVWVDHIGSSGTRRVVGKVIRITTPEARLVPQISPE